MGTSEQKKKYNVDKVTTPVRERKVAKCLMKPRQTPNVSSESIRGQKEAPPLTKCAFKGGVW